MKFRIVTDKFAGYEVQEKAWYHLFWQQRNYINTSKSIEESEEIIKARMKELAFKTVVIAEYPPSIINKVTEVKTTDL